MDFRCDFLLRFRGDEDDDEDEEEEEEDEDDEEEEEVEEESYDEDRIIRGAMSIYYSIAMVGPNNS